MQPDVNAVVAVRHGYLLADNCADSCNNNDANKFAYRPHLMLAKLATHWTLRHNRMRFLIFPLMCFSLTNVCLAENPELQATSFARIYNSFCMRHIDDLDVLRRQLATAPRLASQGAALFLNNMPGSAWPVADLEGLFVLALPEDENLCAVYARRAGAAKTEELFIELISTPAAPFMVRKTGDHTTETTANGTTHTIDYEWYVEGDNRKILFQLSTSSFADAELQVSGVVSTISE